MQCNFTDMLTNETYEIMTQLVKLQNVKVKAKGLDQHLSERVRRREERWIVAAPKSIYI